MSSWLKCRCGETIGVGSFPNPGVSRVLSEEQYDGLQDPVDRTALATLFLSLDSLIRCPRCGGLLLQRAGEPDFEYFSPEPSAR